MNVTAGPDGSPVVEQPNFGGSITAHSVVTKGTPAITVRFNAISPEPYVAAAAVEAVPFTASEAAKTAAIAERVVAEMRERPDLTEAPIVVSGGRGTGLYGVRSGVAASKDAELVPLWVGEYDPALIAGLSDVGVSGT